MKKFTNINAYILAGGKSSRMGVDKGLLPLNGKPLTELVIEQVRQVADKVVIVSNNREYGKFGLEVICDQVREIGPAGGIYSALNHTDKDLNFIVSCDTPFITAGAVRFLAESAGNFEITLPVRLGQTEPLFGIYAKSCADKWLGLIQKKFTKLHEMVTHFNLKKIDVEGNKLFGDRIFTNINTKDDFAKAFKLQVK